MTAPIRPEQLRPHYRAFLDVDQARRDRVLLTGHSHQAWPDVARDGLVEAFDVAAMHVDDKWSSVFEAQDELRRHIVARIGGKPTEIAFGQNTHELVTRFLSGLPLARRPRIVTTTGEFHSADRQLRRLAEEGVEVVFVDASPAATLAERLGAAVDDRTSAVVVSTVLFGSATVVPHLDALVARVRERGVEILLDAYHAFDVVPFTVPDGAYLVAGGYKYAQWGEGACFLRVPDGVRHRPVLTGWFAGFTGLDGHRAHDAAVAYADDGATRFAGSTFDPASFFRARAVARFFDAQGLTPEVLRAVSLAQTSRLLEGVTDLPVEVVTPRAPAERAGFVALRTPRAQELVTALRERGVFTDARGDVLRLGPAPYVTDAEIARGLDALRESLGRR